MREDVMNEFDIMHKKIKIQNTQIKALKKAVYAYLSFYEKCLLNDDSNKSYGATETNVIAKLCSEAISV